MAKNRDRLFSLAQSCYQLSIFAGDLIIRLRTFLPLLSSFLFYLKREKKKNESNPWMDTKDSKRCCQKKSCSFSLKSSYSPPPPAIADFLWLSPTKKSLSVWNAKWFYFSTCDVNNNNKKRNKTKKYETRMIIHFHFHNFRSKWKVERGSSLSRAKTEVIANLYSVHDKIVHRNHALWHFSTALFSFFTINQASFHTFSVLPLFIFMFFCFYSS